MWFKWALIGFFVVDAVGTILSIGVKRQTITPGFAALRTMWRAVLIAGLLYYWR